MGMLMALTMMEQEEAERKAAESAVPVEEEIPFTEPEERVEEPVKEKTVRKSTTVKRRRKTAK